MGLFNMIQIYGFYMGLCGFIIKFGCNGSATPCAGSICGHFSGVCSSSRRSNHEAKGHKWDMARSTSALVLHSSSTSSYSESGEGSKKHI